MPLPSSRWLAMACIGVHWVNERREAELLLLLAGRALEFSIDTRAGSDPEPKRREDILPRISLGMMMIIIFIIVISLF